MRPHLLQRGRADGCRSRVQLRLLVGAAARVDEGALPRALRADQGEGGGGPVHAGRRHVGRARHQPARRRGDGAAVRAGKRFFLEEFGVETEEVWLPDTFGYSAALPQIVKAVGIEVVPDAEDLVEPDEHACPTTPSRGRASTAPGCSPTSRRPTRTTASCPAAIWPAPSATTPTTGRGTVSLLPFGFGDGGGGPTREMMARRRPDRRLEGSPTVRDRHPGALLRRAEAEYPDASGVERRAVSRAAPRHLHHPGPHQAGQPPQRAPAPRGRAVGGDGGRAHGRATTRTTTSSGSGSSCCCSSSTTSFRAPRSPGCTARRSGTTRAVARELEAVIDVGARATSMPASGSYVANAAPLARDGVPPSGRRVRRPRTMQDVEQTASEATSCWTTASCGSVVDERGLIVSLVDLATGREAIAPGAAGNLLQLHRDLPNQWDAWDVDEHYRRSVTEMTGVDAIDVGTDGRPVRSRSERSFGASTIDAAAHAARRVASGRDRQRHRLARAARSCSSSPSRSTCTPTGRRRDAVRPCLRPTHTNTSWESARFEMCAHRWIHVAEPGFGVAIANESTYGYDVGRATRDGRRHHDDRAAVAAARPRSPTPRPTRAGTPAGSPSARGRPSPMPSRRATGPTSASYRQGRAGRQAAGQYLQSGHRRRSDQTGRRPQRRCRRSVVRVLGRTRRR